MNSCSVPRTTSVGDGRKSAGASRPYEIRHQAARTAVGATNPSAIETDRGSGARRENQSDIVGPGLTAQARGSVYCDARTTLMSVRRLS